MPFVCSGAQELHVIRPGAVRTAVGNWSSRFEPSGQSVPVKVSLEADTGGGFVNGFAEVGTALRELRTQFLTTFSGLGADEWLRRSRCELWTVHDVVRHVRDVCKIHVARLRGDPSPFPSEEPFEGQEMPLRWLRHTADETPADTLRDLEQLAAAEHDALAARTRQGGDRTENGPYGPVHWTILTAHIFWDAWLHERDVTEPLGLGHLATAGEDRVAALYGLLIASIPAAFVGQSVATTVGLRASSEQRYIVGLTSSGAALRPAGAQDQTDLEGELLSVLDALAGRGPEVEAVLVGDWSAREPLTWLRAFMVPAR